MDEFNLDIVGRRKKDFRYSCEINEDVVLSLPNFSTIERFLTVGGGKADDIYNNMMSIAFPKSNNPPLNIMDELKNKATMNLLATRSISGFNGLFGIHDNIFKQKYRGPNDLTFWINSSFDLHCIINLPISIGDLLRMENKERLTSLNRCSIQKLFLKARQLLHPKRNFLTIQ